MGSGNQKKVNKSALDRITQLENDNVELLQALDQSLKAVEARFGELTDYLNATIALTNELVAPGAVANKVKDLRQEVKDNKLAAARAALEAGVASGHLVPVESSTTESVVVLKDFDKEGNLLQGRSQILVSGIEESFKSNFLGRKVGDVIDHPSGSKSEILEIYDMVEPDPEVIPAPPEE